MGEGFGGRGGRQGGVGRGPSGKGVFSTSRESFEPALLTESRLMLLSLRMLLPSSQTHFPTGPSVSCFLSPSALCDVHHHHHHHRHNNNNNNRHAHPAFIVLATSDEEERRNSSLFPQLFSLKTFCKKVGLGKG
eukprot:336111-Rhodomonas_salina.1